MVWSAELINKQATSNLNDIAQKIEDLRPDLAAKEIALSARSGVAKFQALQRLTQELSDMVSPKTACKKGCSHCCYQAVSIFEVEARVISKLIGRKYTKPSSTNVLEDRQNFRGVPCTFLVNEKCSIYEQRPIICRTHINMSNVSEICNVDYSNQDIPYLNTSWLNPAIAIICGINFHDIRHWFPKE